MGKKNDVWLIMTPIGCNQLRHIIDGLTSNFPFLKEKVMSNKIRKEVGIT
jgi:hypothetical protein